MTERMETYVVKALRKSVAILLPLIAAALLPASVAAQGYCMGHETAVEELGKRFNEQVAGRGLSTDSKAVFELFVSASGSWTVMVTNVHGKSCIVAAGNYWEYLQPEIGQSS